MKKDFLPIAVGFWGVSLPLFISAFIYCRTLAERISMLVSAVVFFVLGLVIQRAKL